MKKINAKNLDISKLHGEEALWIYNGLDCIVTGDVWNELVKNDTPHSLMSERFVRALQAPALEMMLRGIAVDKGLRSRLIAELEKKLHRVNWIINQYSQAICSKDLNAASSDQKAHIFYEVMKLPPQMKNDKGVRKVSTDRASLEKLLLYREARPLCRALIKAAELGKKLGTLRSGVDRDGRMRTSYNIAGTETARWSSSKNAFGSGTNLQNITEELRGIFIADPGYKVGYVDLDQAESRVVAYISEDLNYINACESGDLHTTVTRMVWDSLGWDDGRSEKEIAKQVFYRHFTYRDMAKRGGHGTNYYGQPQTMAKHLKVDTKLIEDFQNKYFKAFPGIKAWHRDVARRLQLDSCLITALGRSRHFFGRSNDDSTLREAIAFEPQSVVGELLNLALWRMWRATHYGNLRGVQILGQIHDAILFQYPEQREAELIPLVLQTMRTEVPIKGRTMVIPSSVEVGWNWRHYTSENVNGIKQYKGTDERKRYETTTTSLLARRVDGINQRP